MKIDIQEPKDGVSMVALDGRMDPHASNKVRDALNSEPVDGAEAIIVDMSEVTLITSVGIGVLVNSGVGAKKLGRQFVVVAPEGHVAEILRKTNVQAILPIAESVDDALEQIEVSTD